MVLVLLTQVPIIALSSLITYNQQAKDKMNVTKIKESEELLERSFPQQLFFFVGNYGPRMAERWDDMPSMTSEVGEIKVCLYLRLRSGI